MRTLIHELPYERPIASGRFEYARDDEPTGALETWRLTAAQQGYRFLRVDLDGSASSGDNVLYHLTLDADGAPERLKFHFFRSGLQIRGDLLFDGELALLSRDVNGKRLESQASFAPGTPFWFPSCAGLSLLVGAASGEALVLDRSQAFDLLRTRLSVETAGSTSLSLMGREVPVTALVARWEDHERRLWIDEHDWPVRVQRDDLVIQEKRYVRYSS